MNWLCFTVFVVAVCPISGYWIPSPLPHRNDTSGFTPFSSIQQASVAILYDDDNYEGGSRNASISLYNCTDVSDFNDRASSVKIESGCVRLWQHSNCNGRSVDIMEPGESSLRKRDFNDDTSAVSSCDFPFYEESVEVVMHLNGSDDLAIHAEGARQIIIEWFPFIQSQLYTPAYRYVPRIDVYYDDKDGNGNDFIAYAWGTEIHVHKGFIRGLLGEFGVYIHEMTHVLQQPGEGCPGWVVEGTAEYMLRWFYEPETTPTKPTDENLENDYIGDWLLYYLTTILKKPLFYQITKACQEGSYTENWLKDRTGKDEQEWWDQMVNDDSYPWKRVR